VIPQEHIEHWQMLQQAIKTGRAALVPAIDKKTQKPCYVICAINIHEPTIIAPGSEPEYEFVPFARLFDGDPRDELDPPQEQE
jgi:hypothetical protein